MVRVGFPPGSHPRVPGPPMRISMDGTTFHKAKLLLERCESGRIGLTANELTWVTGSEGSNPSLSARELGTGCRATAGRPATVGAPCTVIVAGCGLVRGVCEKSWAATGCRPWAVRRTKWT